MFNILYIACIIFTVIITIYIHVVSCELIMLVHTSVRDSSPGFDYVEIKNKVYYIVENLL